MVTMLCVSDHGDHFIDQSDHVSDHGDQESDDHGDEKSGDHVSARDKPGLSKE